jgi:hypothetical protein
MIERVPEVLRKVPKEQPQIRRGILTDGETCDFALSLRTCLSDDAILTSFQEGGVFAAERFEVFVRPFDLEAGPIEGGLHGA